MSPFHSFVSVPTGSLKPVLSQISLLLMLLVDAFEFCGPSAWLVGKVEDGMVTQMFPHIKDAELAVAPFWSTRTLRYTPRKP